MLSYICNIILTKTPRAYTGYIYKPFKYFNVMVIGKIKPVATVVAQFAAGIEVTAIKHEGKLFLPVVGLDLMEGEDTTETTDISKASKPTSTKPESKAESKEEPSGKTYTKDELMNMESKELVKILKNEFGINPDDYDGKNTNKKLRDLILDAQENGGTSDDKEEEDKDEGEKNGENAGGDTEEDVVDEIATILEDFDAGKKNKKKAIAVICALSDNPDEDKVAELVGEFEDDAEADLDDMASKIAENLTLKEEKPAPKKGPKRKAKEDLVDVDDLEVGDRVSVWWDDDNQEWFSGEVKSKKKDKVVIAYDDDTEEAIDPEVHTKIKRLAE